MRFPYRSKNRSTIPAANAEPADITSHPRLRARSSLDRFTVSKKRTRLPSSTSSQPEPMEIQTAQDILTAASSRTTSSQGGYPNYSYPDRHRPTSPTTKDADVLVALRADVQGKGSTEEYPYVKSQPTASSASESSTDLKRDCERRTGQAFRRERTLVDVETQDSASEGTRVPDSASTSRRNFSDSSTSSEGLETARSLEEYSLLAREHGLDPLEFGLAEIANEVELTPGAKHHVPKILRKSSSLNKIVIFTTKHFHKKASAADLHKDTLKGRTLQELSLIGVATLKLPPEFAVGELLLPTFLRNLATFLYNEGRKAPGIFRVSGQYHHIYNLYNYYASQYPKASEASKIQKSVASTSLPVHLKHEVNDVAALFTKIIRGLPGGLLGSMSLFNAFSGIEAKFRPKNKAQEWKDSPNLVEAAEKKFAPKTKPNPAQAKLIALAISSIVSPYRKALVIGFLGLAAIIGYETEQAYADPLAETSELMSYHSLGVVLGPVLLGDRMFEINPAAPKITATDDSFDESDNSQSGPSRLYVPIGVTGLKDHAMVTASVMEMLITVWRDVVTQLREIERKGVGPYARIRSRVTSGQSEISRRLSGVEENPQLEDQLKADQVETMSTQGSMQDEAGNLGIRKQRWRNPNGTAASSQATGISHLKGGILYHSGFADSYRRRSAHPIVNHPDAHRRDPSILTQDNTSDNDSELEDDTRSLSNGETPSLVAGKYASECNSSPRETGSPNPPLRHPDLACDRPGSRSYSCSQLSLREDDRTPSVKGNNFSLLEVSQLAQGDTGRVTESTPTSDEVSSARNDNRRWGIITSGSLHKKEGDGDAEGILVPDPRKGTAQNADEKSFRNFSSQETPGINHSCGNEYTRDIQTQAPAINQPLEDHAASPNAGNPATEADTSNYKRPNSVKRIARKFEAAQRQGSGSMNGDTPSSMFGPSVNSSPNVGPRKQIGVPIAIRLQENSELSASSSPTGSSQIPKPVLEHGRGRTGQSSSPSPARTITPRPHVSVELAVTSGSPVEGDAPLPSGLVRQPTRRALLSAPVGAKMRSLSSYATPSLERMRSRKNERTPTAPFQSHSASTTSLRLEGGLPLHPPQGTSLYAISRTSTSSTSLHGTSPLAPPRVASLAHTTGAATSSISQTPHTTIPQRARKDLLPRKRTSISLFDGEHLPAKTTGTPSSLASVTGANSSHSTFKFEAFLLRTAALITDPPEAMRSLTNGQAARITQPKSSSANPYLTESAPESQHAIISDMVRQLQEHVHHDLRENQMAKGTAVSEVRERLVQARLAESAWKLHAGFLENLLSNGVQEGESVAKMGHAGHEFSESEQFGAMAMSSKCGDVVGCLSR